MGIFKKKQPPPGLAAPATAAANPPFPGGSTSSAASGLLPPPTQSHYFVPPAPGTSWAQPPSVTIMGTSSGWAHPQRDDYLESGELDEVASALSAWAKLRKATAAGPYFARFDPGVRGDKARASTYGPGLGVGGVIGTLDLSSDKRGERLPGAILRALSSGGRVWVIVEEP